MACGSNGRDIIRARSAGTQLSERDSDTARLAGVPKGEMPVGKATSLCGGGFRCFGLKGLRPRRRVVRVAWVGGVGGSAVAVMVDSLAVVSAGAHAAAAILVSACFVSGRRQRCSSCLNDARQCSPATVIPLSPPPPRHLQQVQTDASVTIRPLILTSAQRGSRS